MDVPILYTKFYIPQAAPGELIARRHLTQQLTRKLSLKNGAAALTKLW